MHLGFHIYDTGFQSPNLGTANPMVYATALLILAVVNLLNLAAMIIRARLREEYKSAKFCITVEVANDRTRKSEYA